MAKLTSQEIRILYVQVRKDDATKQEELAEFVRFSGLTADQFTVLNVFDTPHFDAAKVLAGHHAFFVGGTSDDGDSLYEPEDFAFLPSVNALIRYCFDNNIPSFCSCFGFQAALKALGSDIIFETGPREMGTPDIYLTEYAQTEDTLFRDVPVVFPAVSVHKKTTTHLPEGGILLAYADHCKFHAFTFKDKPFYAFQFHPEIDRTDLIARLYRYKDKYMDNDGAMQKVIDEARDTDIANSLVRLFVDRILLA